MSKSQTPHPELSPAQMIDEIIFNIEEAPKQGYILPPIMMWGQPGVGKSDIVRQVGAKLNRIVVDIRLLLKDPTDLSGLPYFNSHTLRMEYGAPSELPPSASEMHHLRKSMKMINTESKVEVVEVAEVPPTDREQADLNDKLNDLFDKKITPDEFDDEERSQLMWLVQQGNAIIFLDELSAAPPAVQAAALQLVLDRKVGTYHLPKEVSLIAAGNRSEDNAVHFQMPTPLRNRFSHFTVVVSYDSWEKWAVNRKVHPAVVGFLKAKSSNLNTFDPKNRHVYAFATPRSWEFVSNVLWALSDKNGKVDMKNSMNRIKNQVSSIVGTGTASEFIATFEIIGKLPDPMDILEGKCKTHDMSQYKNSAAYALIVSLCHRMDDVQRRLSQENSDKGTKGELADTMTRYGDNYFRFLMDNLDYQEDFIILGATIALAQYNLNLSDCDELEALLDEHDQILTEI